MDINLALFSSVTNFFHWQNGFKYWEKFIFLPALPSYNMMLCQLWWQHWFVIPACSNLLCYFLSCGNTNPCVVTLWMKSGNWNSILKYFLDLINSQVQGEQAAAVWLVISGAEWLEWEETDGKVRMGTAIRTAYHDVVPWQVSAGGFLAGYCWPLLVLKIT